MSGLTMLLGLAWRSIVRLPRRSAGAVAGTALSVGLLSAVLFFVDASAHSMTGRALSGVSAPAHPSNDERPAEGEPLAGRSSFVRQWPGVRQTSEGFSSRNGLN